MELVFLDKFDRADANNVGNGWDTYIHPATPGTFGIRQESLLCRYGDGIVGFGIVRPCSYNDVFALINIIRIREPNSFIQIALGNNYIPGDESFRGYILQYTGKQHLSLLKKVSSEEPEILDSVYAYTGESDIGIAYVDNRVQAVIDNKVALSIPNQFGLTISHVSVSLQVYPGTIYTIPGDIYDGRSVALDNFRIVKNYERPTERLASVNMDAEVEIEFGTRWYWLTYDPNGGQGSIPRQRGLLLTLADTGFTKDGEVMREWSLTADGTGTRYPLGGTIEIDRDRTIYPVWGPYKVRNHYALGEQVTRRYSFGRPIKKTYCKGKLVWEW